MREDHAFQDITTRMLFPRPCKAKAVLIAKQDCVVAGLPLIPLIFSALKKKISLTWYAADGKRVRKNSRVAVLSGDISGILSAERTILNFISRLSGIATLTNQYASALKGTGARVFDTRKTAPGWRELEKYAVVCGGGRNHRMHLADGVLVKDNHLAGRSIAELKTAIERWHAKKLSVEVEVDSLAQLARVLPLSPDIILLDNFSLRGLKAAVRRRDALGEKLRIPRPQLEVSGNVTLKTIRSRAVNGVSRISVGALTHSAPSIDFSLEIICH